MVPSLKKLIKELFNVSLYKYQEDFIYDCLNNQRVLGCFCRQTGKSMSIAITASLEALRNPNGHIVIVAPTDRQAGELFVKIADFIKTSSILMQEIESITQRQVILKNNCRISAYPVGDNGDNIRGLTAHVLIMEECAFIKDSIVTQVLMPMVAATNGKVIKISTPFGLNHFYLSSRDGTYISHKYTWQDAVKVGHFTQQFIEEQRLQCSSLQFRTEYEAEFIADEDAYFSHELIDSCKRDYELIRDSDNIEIGEYYLGVDFARQGQDSSVFLIVKKEKPNKVVYIKELPKNTMDEAFDVIEYLHNKFKFRKIICDQTGLGAGVVDMLARKYNPRGAEVIKDYRFKYNSNDIVIGTTFTIQTKEDIFSNLKMLMEQKNLIFPMHTKLIYQLKDFRYEATPSGHLKLHHSDNGFDDYCDSLACACHGLGTPISEFFFM